MIIIEKGNPEKETRRRKNVIKKIMYVQYMYYLTSIADREGDALTLTSLG